jgi:hypothetical protein
MTTIDKQLDEAKQISVLGRDAESRKSELEPIKAKRDQAKSAYGAKRDELLRRWNDQLVELTLLQKDIVSVFPHYTDLIDEWICKKALSKIETQKGEVLQRRGKNEAAVVKTAHDVESTKANLDAWLSIDQQLAARLKDIDDGIKKIRDVFGGEDQVFSIYLLWFKTLPTFISIASEDKAGEAAALGDNREDRQCTAEVQYHPVYLVEVGGYSAEVDKALSEYDDARKAKKAADVEFKADADDLANELKNLKDLTLRVDQDVATALKESQSQPQP